MRSRGLLLLWVVSISVLIPCGQVHAWGRAHGWIRMWALSQLSEELAKTVEPESLQRLATKYTSLQDTHAAGDRPDLDRYCKPPGVRVSLHDVNPAVPTAKGMRWYLEQIVGNIRANKHDEAMKFLGVLCHWCEDPGSLSAHSSPVSEATLRKLLPPPNGKRNFHYLYGYGWINLEGSDKSLLPPDDYAPKRLGLTVEEVTLRLVQRQKKLRDQAAADIVPAIQARLAEDDQAFRKVVGSALRRNAELIADLIHSTLALASGEDFLAAVDTNLNTIPLETWLPEEPVARGLIAKPYYAVPFLVDASLDAERKLLPLEVFDNERRTREVKGFGVGAPVKLRFILAPATAVSQFRTSVGLHPAAKSPGEMQFRVWLDDRLIAESRKLIAGDAAHELVVEIPPKESVVLTLESVAASEAGVVEAQNLGVWANPVLTVRRDGTR